MNVGVLTAIVLGAAAQTEQDPPPPATNEADLRRSDFRDFAETDTITGSWWGHGDELAERGVTLTLNFWMVWQAVIEGGTDKDQGSTGEYRLAGHFDLERLAGIRGGGVFARVDGGWSDPPDLTGIGAIMPVDGEFAVDSPAILTHLWYQQNLFDTRLRLRFGLFTAADGMDFHGQTVAFDANAYANFGGGQFLNSGLINNASIHFPGTGSLGAAILAEPIERVYVAAAINNVNESRDFLDALNLSSDWMVLVEAGVVPDFKLPGMYSIGFWHTSLPGSPSAQGVYLGMNQLLHSEEPGDIQGLGMFARYGYADSSPDGVRNFWSLGGQYRGMFPTRDRDVAAIGWAQAFTDGSPIFTAAYEGVLESYYRVRVTPWFFVTPMIQYIVNPGSTATRDAVVFSLRGQFVF